MHVYNFATRELLASQALNHAKNIIRFMFFLDCTWLIFVNSLKHISNFPPFWDYMFFFRREFLMMGFDVLVMGIEIPTKMCVNGNFVSCLMMFPWIINNGVVFWGEGEWKQFHFCVATSPCPFATITQM